MPAERQHRWLSRLLGLGLTRILKAGQSTSHPVQILALMRGDADCEVISEVASRMKWSVTLSSQEEQATKPARLDTFAVILYDRDVTANWKGWLTDLVQSAPHSAVILVSPIADSNFWDEVTSRGGYDVLRKPLTPESVSAVVGRAVTYWQMR